MFSPIQWGVDLVRELARSGTGDAKLAIARKAIEDRWIADQTHATAAEILLALEAANVGEPTLQKARSLIQHGTAFVVTTPKLNIEDLLPPPPNTESDTFTTPGSGMGDTQPPATVPTVPAGPANVATTFGTESKPAPKPDDAFSLPGQPPAAKPQTPKGKDK